MLHVVVLALNCAVELALGLVFTIIPDHVQRYSLKRRDSSGMVRWLARFDPLDEPWQRFTRSDGFIVLLKTAGYISLLMSGITAGFLVSFILRA